MRETKDLTLSDDDLKTTVKVFFEIVAAEEYDDEPQIDEVNNRKDLNTDDPDYYNQPLEFRCSSHLK